MDLPTPLPVVPAGDLLLRPWRADDETAARRVHGGDAGEALAWLAGRNGPGRADWAVVDAASGEALGHVALKQAVADLYEIGYRTAPDARGLGAATTAARALCQWAFEQGIPKVVWLARTGNEPSWRVAHAVGFRYEGRRRGELPPDPDGSRPDAWSGGLLPGDAGGDHPLPWFPDPVLTDGDLVVRRFREADLDGWLAMRNEHDVVRHGHGGRSRRALTRGEAWDDLFVDAVEHRMTGTGMDLAIILGGEVAGNVAFRRSGGGALLSWWVGSAYRGRRAAARAAVLVADRLRESGGVDRLEARIHTANVGSQRAAEAAGLLREGRCVGDSPWDADAHEDGYLYGCAVR